ncbi:NAPDH-dependent diflavin reductase [Spiromyces aspiralis]|uniref:NAPDH-dependent diflavin reductase n=1 Tax=Spiromyces aspiralis TaxID=68401 RepID=A0ACC1HV79_9FUNG|nr:NAPDH-dependent diflavin reductase [Spiromyces aspiralis]
MPTSQDTELTILYGSQTGCAEDVAKRIAREGWRRHFKVHVQELDEFDRQKLFTTSPIVFVCSTTGQGDEPDNMKVGDRDHPHIYRPISR